MTLQRDANNRDWDSERWPPGEENEERKYLWCNFQFISIEMRWGHKRTWFCIEEKNCNALGWSFLKGYLHYLLNYFILFKRNCLLVDYYLKLFKHKYFSRLHRAFNNFRGINLKTFSSNNRTSLIKMTSKAAQLKTLWLKLLIRL